LGSSSGIGHTVNHDRNEIMAVNKEKNLVAFLLQVFPKYMQRDAFPNLWQRAAMAACIIRQC